LITIYYNKISKSLPLILYHLYISKNGYRTTADTLKSWT